MTEDPAIIIARMRKALKAIARLTLNSYIKKLAEDALEGK